MERKGTRLMRQAVKQMAVIAGILLVFCVVCRLTVKNTYYAVIPLPETAVERADELRVEAEGQEVILEGTPQVKDGYLRVPIRPGQKGNTTLNVLDREGNVVTAHSTNPVPVILVNGPKDAVLRDGALCDLAPTLLELMELPVPPEMEGRSLLR